jgi:hypothetical protein
VLAAFALAAGAFAAAAFAAAVFVAAVAFVLAPEAPCANAAADHVTDPKDTAVKPAIMRARVPLFVCICRSPTFQEAHIEPRVPDNSSTCSARKYEVIMFHAAPIDRSEAAPLFLHPIFVSNH